MNNVQLELWHLITLLLMFLGASAGVGKLLLSRTEKHLDMRFNSLDKEAQEWKRVEREVMNLKAELPREYVRRDDYIRGQSVIEAKLDALALRLQGVQIKQIEVESEVKHG